MAKNIFEQFDEVFGKDYTKEINDLQANNGGNREFEELQDGTYIVEVEQCELGKSKADKPMAKIVFKVIDGEFKGRKLFYNQVVTEAFQFHNVNEMLRSLNSGVTVQYDGTRPYANLGTTMLDVHEAIDGKLEYDLLYKTNAKGYKTFKITGCYDKY